MSRRSSSCFPLLYLVVSFIFFHFQLFILYSRLAVFVGEKVKLDFGHGVDVVGAFGESGQEKKIIWAKRRGRENVKIEMALLESQTQKY